MYIKNTQRNKFQLKLKINYFKYLANQYSILLIACDTTESKTRVVVNLSKSISTFQMIFFIHSIYFW